MVNFLGILGVFAAVFGGYALAGGKFGVILHALGPEMVIIGGSGAMTLLVMGDAALVGKAAKGLGGAFKGPRWGKGDYVGALSTMFLLLRVLRAEGAQRLERHIEKPESSPLFARVPRIAADKALVALVCDVLRTVTLNSKDPHVVEGVLEAAIEKMHADSLKPAKAMQSVADAFPALGIVAAVLGVIKAMGSISESPEILGGMIGSALVGTFLGVFLSYGIVGPLAARMKAIADEERAMPEAVRAVIVSSLQDLQLPICVEYGRQEVPSAHRPGFAEMDDALKEAARAARSMGGEGQGGGE